MPYTALILPAYSFWLVGRCAKPGRQRCEGRSLDVRSLVGKRAKLVGDSAFGGKCKNAALGTNLGDAGRR